MRVGIGYDSHRFTEGDYITLGGVIIPFHQGVLAHSDGDVLLHAACDALLGALALGDIGQHFPDTNSEFENQCSIDFFKTVYGLVVSKGYQLFNLDSVAQLTHILLEHGNNNLISIGINAFANIALVTSFLGVTLGLLDFILDSIVVT